MNYQLIITKANTNISMFKDQIAAIKIENITNIDDMKMFYVIYDEYFLICRSDLKNIIEFAGISTEIDSTILELNTIEGQLYNICHSLAIKMASTIG